MSPADVPGRVQAFVAAALVREGAEVEPAGEGRIFAVLPAPLPHELSLAEACVLVFHDEKADGEGAGGAGPFGQEPAGGSVPCPLEGSTVQALIDRARERGRRAATRLSVNAGPAARRLEEARRRLSLLNATLADAQASIGIEATLVLEFSYEARSEERADGSVFVSVPEGGGVPSAASGAALLSEVASGAVMETGAEDVDPAAVERAAAVAAPTAEAEIRRLLRPFMADRRRRLAVESQRVAEYHDRLLREARKRSRRVGSGAEGVAESKEAAILRQRAERLADLQDRHAVETTYALSSILLVRHEVVVVRMRVRRRKREIPLDVRWDPVIQELVGPACAACRTPTLTVHACDEAGHLTCSRCAQACPTCSRVVCRACRPAGCGCPSGMPALQDGPRIPGADDSSPSRL